MEEKAVNSWLDIAPAYLNFLLKFLRSPREAFAGAAIGAVAHHQQMRGNALAYFSENPDAIGGAFHRTEVGKMHQYLFAVGRPGFLETHERDPLLGPCD